MELHRTHGIRLDIDAKAEAQEMLESVAGHLDDDMRDQIQDRLAQQALPVVAPCSALR